MKGTILLPGSLCLGMILFGACQNPENQRLPDSRFTAAVWNVEALFDGEDTGNEYAEFRGSAGWTKEKYAARVLAIGNAITRMVIHGGEDANGEQAGGPDLIGLVELENAKILEDLGRGPLSKQGYHRVFFGGGAEGALSLGLGVISRFPLTESRVHSVTVGGKTPPRPILEVRLEPGDGPLVFFLCHWKSKVGGEAATESLRRASARVLRRRLLELEQEAPGTPVIIMGDLNENHDEFYRQGSKAMSALVPDTPDAALFAETANTPLDFLVLSNEKPPRSRHFTPELPALYTPWENELEGGSYYYRDNWETIDHFLLSKELFDNSGWEFDTCRVLNRPPFSNAGGRPAAYNTKSGQGLSDHLPLLLILEKAKETRTFP